MAVDFAAGSGAYVALGVESTWGTLSTGAYLKQKITNEGLSLSKSINPSDTINDTRNITTVTEGIDAVSGDINFELFYKYADQFFEGALFDTFATATPGGIAYITLTADPSTGALTSGDTITIADGAAPTDAITAGTYTVLLVDSTGASGNVVINAAVPASYASGDSKITHVNGTACTDDLITGATGTLAGNVQGIFNGVASGCIPYSIEKGFVDLTSDLFHQYSGCVTGGLNLSVQPDPKTITGSVSFTGKTLTVSGTTTTGSFTSTASGYGSNTMTLKSGSLIVDGTAFGIASGLDLSLDNGLNPLNVLASSSAAGIIAGRTNVSGSLSAFFQNDDLTNDFINGTEVSLAMVFEEIGSEGATNLQTNQYAVYLPRVRYTGADTTIGGEGEITQSVPFQAFADSNNVAIAILKRDAN